jgi:protein OS-9
MVISTPRLCNDVAFQPPKASKPHAIACTPVLPEASIPAYLADKEATDIQLDANLDVFLEEEIRAHLADGIPLQKSPIIIGDIEVGGHAIVPPGKKIEKSVVVGGGKETLIATIAKSDGYMASESDMKRVGIRTHREVEGVKKEVERVAGGKAWRLDVVETPRGKELRGVIEEEKDEKTKEGGDKIGKRQGKTLLDVKKEQVRPADKKVESEEKEKEIAGEPEEGSDETYKEEL